MKRILSLLLTVMVVFGMHANTLYVVGAGDGLAWDPANPKAVELVDNAFSFDVKNLTQFKISTVKGTWNAFNAAAKCATINEADLGTPVTLSPSDGNIGAPYKGDYHIVVAGDLSTITMTSSTAAPDPDAAKVFYLRGGMNGWVGNDTWKFTQKEGKTYTLTCAIPKGTEFKIGDADWNFINYGGGGQVDVESSKKWFYNDKNAIMAEDFDGIITVVLPDVAKDSISVTFSKPIVVEPDPVVVDSLYVLGNGTGLGWNPAAPLAVAKADGTYTFKIDNLVAFKISKAKSSVSTDWTDFNAGAYVASVTKADLGKAVTLYEGDGNIETPWKGNYTVVVAGDYSTITLTTDTPEPTGPAVLYLRGGMNNWGNSAADLTGWQFNTTDGKTYSLTCKIPKGTEFKLADANWGSFNHGAGKTVSSAADDTWYYNGQNSVMGEDFEGTVTATVPAEAKAPITVKFTSTTGVGNVAVDGAEAQYFNLQGQPVTNPQNGIFIMRQGGKVCKVIRN